MLRPVPGTTLSSSETGWFPGSLNWSIHPQLSHLGRETVAMMAQPFPGTLPGVTGYTVNSKQPTASSMALHALTWSLSWRPACLANRPSRRMLPPARRFLALSAFSRSTMRCTRPERLVERITRHSFRLRLSDTSARSAPSTCRGRALHHASTRSTRDRLTNIKPVYHSSICTQWPVPLLRARK